MWSCGLHDWGIPKSLRALIPVHDIESLFSIFFYCFWLLLFITRNNEFLFRWLDAILPPRLLLFLFCHFTDSLVETAAGWVLFIWRSSGLQLFSMPRNCYERLSLFDPVVAIYQRYSIILSLLLRLSALGLFLLLSHIRIALACETFQNLCILDNAIPWNKLDGRVYPLITVIIVIPTKVNITSLATRMVRLLILCLASQAVGLTWNNLQRQLLFIQNCKLCLALHYYFYRFKRVQQGIQRLILLDLCRFTCVVGWRLVYNVDNWYSVFVFFLLRHRWVNLPDSISGHIRSCIGILAEDTFDSPTNGRLIVDGLRNLLHLLQLIFNSWIDDMVLKVLFL